ncbi:hypothetical protein [Mangrovicoccus sp. HB161399]|uniref:hypothetical protein n=1 Tax=Mangrovicoccus sp. HB161399 TaxID=2720392 RepID=UPI0015523B75|nr:hypothetical protein [Mangrovicoccus sp. HB161399]
MSLIRLSVPAALAVLLASACSHELSPSRTEALYASLPPAKQRAYDAALEMPPGQAVGQLLVGVLFASQCPGIEIDETFGKLAESKLTQFKRTGGDIETAALQQAIEDFSKAHGVDPVDLKDPPIGCPIARQEIEAGTLTGALLMLEDPAS